MAMYTTDLAAQSAASAALHASLAEAPGFPVVVPPLTEIEQVPVGSSVQPKLPGPSEPDGSDA